MAISELSFSASEQFRRKLLVSNLEPYYVKNSSTQLVPKSQVGTKEYIWNEIPLVGQPDLVETGRPEKTKLYGVNQYGPQGGYTSFVQYPIIVKSANQGEFDWPNATTKKFTENEFFQKELIVTNQYGPQNGWEDASSELEVNIVQPDIRGEYYSFVSSSYSPFNILTNKNPRGDNGTLSQDSALAKLAATNLKKLFEASIAYETYQQTIGRANALVTNGDPYRILNLITGRQPLLEPDWKITVPAGLIGRGLDFISRLAGLYSPYSIIPGDYFSTVGNKSLTNQVINRVTGVFGFPNVLPERKSSSDIFLAYSSGGQKKALFSNLRVNRYAPDYKGNFLGNLNLNAPPGNYYIGSRLSEPLDIVSPSGEVPVNEFGVEIQTNVYGPSVLGKLYENDVEFQFGLNSIPTIEGGGIQGGFTWVSPKYKGNAGIKVGKEGETYGQDNEFASISAQYSRSESTNYPLKSGSILDDTQRIIQSQPNGAKRLRHVGNAIDQVSKVFNDGYKEITKGSRVIRYVDNNGTFKGEEYGRVFAKDIPYLDNSKLQKTDGNIRKNPFSILNNTYNLNMYPTTGPESTTLGGGSVKKYMLSLENLAWRTSRRAGVTFNDLPESEKGPNGGRIMWFPPYDLTFSDSNSVQWENNTFLGRPEDIYTYKSTNRSGQLGFKIVVDHPSVMNLLVNQVLNSTASSQISDQIIDSFFAGLTKFDVYELSKRYTNFSQTELSQLQKLINGSGNREKIKEAINSNLPKGGDGAGGSMESNNTVGLPTYTPQLGKFKNQKFYFDYLSTGGENYITSCDAYLSNPQLLIGVGSLVTEIAESRAALTAFTESVKTVLNTNANVTIQIILRAGESFNEGNVDNGRNNCIEDSLKSLIGENKRVSYVKTNVGSDDTIQPQNYRCSTQTLNNYDVGPVACRRVFIADIIETTLPNLVNPNGGVATGPIPRIDRLIGQNGNVDTPTTRGLTEEQISKQVIRKLLSEADYFQFVKESNPFVYDSLKEKLKYFHPAFHSMTPEGLNERLTFLLQCTRPGDTIPTMRDGKLIDKDALNTSFGSPPICILRIGDFYHSKVVIDSCNFSYEDGGKFDLNPEGIGVQPMIVSVSMGFKFIGGQGLRGPIDELQNALSFNFFANTEMYDERATDSASVSAYNKEFIETTEPTGDTPQNTNTNLQNEGGAIIGSLDGSFTDSGKTGNSTYKAIFGEFVDGFEEYCNALRDKLSEVNDSYNDGILMLYTQSKDGGRKFFNGKLDEWGGSPVNVQIFGKSDYSSKIDDLFTKLLLDIENNNLDMLKFTMQTFKNEDKTLFKQQLKQAVTEKKKTFTDNLITITQDLSQIQCDFIRKIDKINYVLQSADGFIDTKGDPKIYTTTSATTINLLRTNFTSFSSQMGDLITQLELFSAITNTYNSEQTYELPGGSFKNQAPEKRFFLVFGNDLVKFSTLSALTDKLLGSLSKNKDFNLYVIKEIDKIKVQAELEKKIMDNSFSKYKKTNVTKKVYIPDNIAELKKLERASGLTLIESPTEEQKQRLKNLYLGQNSNNTDNFNGKIKF